MEHVFSLPSLVVALSLVALLSALMLLKSTLSGKTLPGCGPGSSCDEVTASRWSRLGPLPTTLPGAALYLAMLAAALLVALGSVPNSPLRAHHAELARRAATSLGFCSLLAAGGAIWFTALQAFVIRKFCRYCMLTHLSALAAAAIALLVELPSQGPQGTLSQGLYIAAGVVLGLFIIGQIAIVPRLYAITETADADEAAGTDEPEAPDEPEAEPSRPEPPAPVAAALAEPAAAAKDEPVPGPAPARAEARPVENQVAAAPPAAPVETAAAAREPAPPAAPRRIHAVGKKISLSPHLWPVLGDREATHIIIDQFDYSCHFCRDLHKLLRKAVAARPAELALLLMPMPMNAACNPMVKVTPAEHRDACEYARYALAVFRAAPERFAEMDEWLFEPIRPWAVDLVKMKAELLVGGADKLAAAMADPWMAKRHNESLAIYNAVEQGQLPKMLFEHAVVSGPIPSYEQLLEVFEKVQLFSPRPANRG
ncbi:MAG: vitamin K epoxide reductase family protein [Tepidisphaerales bacterium]